MASIKSTKTEARTALKPQRRRGEQRVAALMQAGADVIAEKGLDAATMAEVAMRAGAQIGSLYRFFPNKDALANALIERLLGRVTEIFDRIEAEVATLSVSDLADALLDVLVELRGETQAVVALLEARSDWTAMRLAFRRQIRRRVAGMLLLRNPKLAKRTAEDVAVVLLQNMKSMGALSKEVGNEVRPAAIAELRLMTRLYLAVKLGEPLPRAK